MKLKSAVLIFVGLIVLILSLSLYFTTTRSKNESKNVQTTENNDANENKSVSYIDPRLINNSKIVAKSYHYGNDFTEMRTEYGYISIYYVPSAEGNWAAKYLEYGKDGDSSKMYTLDLVYKQIRKVKSVDTDTENFYKNFGSGDDFTGFISENLFSFRAYKKDFQKIGNDKIAGRDTTIYYLKEAETGRPERITERTIWIDNEYDILMKLVTTYHDEKSKGGRTYVDFEVTEFKIGGNKISDLIDLSDYKDPV